MEKTGFHWFIQNYSMITCLIQEILLPITQLNSIVSRSFQRNEIWGMPEPWNSTRNWAFRE
jgi:hypothetical protein